MATVVMVVGLVVVVAVVVPGVVGGDSRRKVLHLPGDLLLGGLFPMHEQVPHPTTSHKIKINFMI